MNETPQRRLAAIVSADVVGYSRLMGVDETSTLADLRAHRAELIDPKIAEHGGRIVKVMGDGLLLEYPSVVAATQCVIEIQQGMVTRNQGIDDGRRIVFRIGINLGDIIIEGEDILGDGVNIAARLQEIAEPGGIAISARVYEDIRDRLEANFEDTGEQSLKNIARPVHVWRWAAQAKTAPVPLDQPLPLPDKPSIVVLPFNNMSGDEEQEYFADGITEDITTELSRYQQLFVIARNTAFTYRGQSHNIQDIATELGVHFVLEGSVRKAGNRVRINAQLIDGQNGNHLWAERFDGDVDEIFDLQDDVTHQVVSATVPQIAEAQLARLRRGERIFDEAHDLALQARDDLDHANSQSDPVFLASCKEKASRAIALNDRCFPAYTSLCVAYWQELLKFWTDDGAETKRLLEQTAQHFVALAPANHSAHYCAGIANMMVGRAEAGAQNMRHSLSLNPNDTLVMGLLSNVEAYLEHFSEAKSLAAQVIRRNPKGTYDTGTAYLSLAEAAYAEDDDNFRDFAEKAIQHHPTAPVRRAFMIAHAARTGDGDLLREHWRLLHQISPRFIANALETEHKFFATAATNEKIMNALGKIDLATGELKSG